MIEFTNTSGKLQATTLGGQLLSWQVKNGEKWVEILYQGSEQKRTGIPILFPFADPLDNNIFLPTNQEIPQHGFARNSIWQHIPTPDGITLMLKSTTLDSQWQQAYPYDFELFVRFEVSKNTLAYTTKVVNLGQTPIPIAPGIHPYFPVIHQQKKLIMTSLTDFDFATTDWDNFKTAQFSKFIDSGMTFVFPNFNLKIYSKELSGSIDHLVIWSQGLGQNDADFVCLEPFTRATNEINTNPILVEDTWQMKVELEVELKN